MFNYRKNIFISFSIMFVLLGLTAIITFLIDPLQFYRKATLYKPYAFEQRYMVWGLLKNYKYDSILIGTSMADNFRKDYVDNDLNLNILRVQLAGATAHEKHLVIQKALEYKKVSTIVYGLDFFSFSVDKNKINTIPLYMMDNVIYNDFKYLLNIDMLLKKNITLLRSNYFAFKPHNININTFWNWNYGDKFHKEMWVHTFKDNLKKSIKETSNIHTLKESFDYNILSIIKSNKNIKFNIFFPPYSILSWKEMEYNNILKTKLKFKEYIMIQLSKYKNVKAYDFQIAQNITHNLDNYMDSVHHSPDINRLIIQLIKNDAYLIKKDNINQYLNKLKNQIKNYDLNQTTIMQRS